MAPTLMAARAALASEKAAQESRSVNISGVQFRSQNTSVRSQMSRENGVDGSSRQGKVDSSIFAVV